MNILFLDHFNFHGGAQEYILDIADEMLREGSLNRCWVSECHTISTLAKRISQHKTPGVGIFQAGMANVFDIGITAYKLRKFIIKEDIELIHCNSVPSLFFAFFLKLTTNITVIYTAHDCNLPQFKLLLVRTIPDAIIGVSQTVCNYLKDNGTKIDVRLIYNGLPDFSVDKKHDDICRVLLPGRLAPIKGIELLIAAAEKIGAKFRDVKFIIVGHGENSNYVKLLKDSAKHLSNVEFYPFSTSKQELYSSADIVVNTSTYVEPLGRTLIEAGIVSIPVIGPDIGGPTEIIENEINGLLFKSGSLDSLIEALQKLCSSEQIRGKMGLAGRLVYEDKFMVSNVTQKILELYKEFIQKKS